MRAYGVSVIAILAALMTVVLTGCNTMEGLGEDMEEAGDAIEQEAEE